MRGQNLLGGDGGGGGGVWAHIVIIIMLLNISILVSDAPGKFLVYFQWPDWLYGWDIFVSSLKWPRNPDVFTFYDSRLVAQLARIERKITLSTLPSVNTKWGR